MSVPNPRRRARIVVPPKLAAAKLETLDDVLEAARRFDRVLKKNGLLFNASTLKYWSLLTCAAARHKLTAPLLAERLGYPPETLVFRWSIPTSRTSLPRVLRSLGFLVKAFELQKRSLTEAGLQFHSPILLALLRRNELTLEGALKLIQEKPMNAAALENLRRAVSTHARASASPDAAAATAAAATAVGLANAVRRFLGTRSHRIAPLAGDAPALVVVLYGTSRGAPAMRKEDYSGMLSAAADAVNAANAPPLRAEVRPEGDGLVINFGGQFASPAQRKEWVEKVSGMIQSLYRYHPTTRYHY